MGDGDISRVGGHPVARQIKVGLALGGGFARGIAHVGVLQALLTHNIPIDYVAGTSVGSLVGAMFCAGLDPFLVERAAERTNWRALVRLKLRREGLLDAEGLERFLLGNVGDLQFHELRIPFVATATDLNTGTEVLLSEGRVAPAVRASCAFPGIFLPVRMGNRMLVDGGLVNNVPTTVSRRMGADVVVAVDLNRPAPEQRPPRNLLHIMLYSLAIVQRPQIIKQLQEADVLIQPDLNAYGVVEIERVREMVEIGRNAAEETIPAIRAAIARAEESQPREVRVATVEKKEEA